MNNKLLIISGPTAVGKTETSLTLAKKLNGEIINADSMQVYKGMDIGTAKLPENEREGIPHHLFDIVEPTIDYDVATYASEAKKVIADIHKRGKLPILVGGTGLYIQAVLYDIDFNSQPPDEDYRKELAEIASQKGNDHLFEMLKKVDPESCEIIHKNNTKRVIRALEYYHTTGEKISIHNKEQREKPSPYDFHYAVLTLPREVLYERIDKRVDIMMEARLVDEVKTLLASGVTRDNTSMQGLGYKEIAAYLEGECSLDEAVTILKRDTRHFAKRQLTWFKREREVTYYDKLQIDQLIDFTYDFKEKP